MTTWNATDPGNAAMDAQRDEALTNLVTRLGRPVHRSLDLGCGRGQVLSAIGLSGIGVDLSILRLRLAPLPVAQADATRLPVASGAFDLVLAGNVVSSIPDDGARRALADEIRRVLSPGGVVLWYDQRWPNPGNRSTRPVSRRDLAQLFPEATIQVEPITVLPALARRFPRRYDLLHRIGPLRSHLIGLIEP